MDIWNLYLAIFIGQLVLRAVNWYVPTEFNGATCAYIKNDDTKSKKVGNINIAVEYLTLKDKSDSLELDLPVLIFKYTDRTNFTNIPTLDEFRKHYHTPDVKFNEDLINFNDNKFNLHLVEDEILNENHILNDHLHYNPQLTQTSVINFKVKRSGLYCAYVAVPPNAKNVELSTHFENSYGQLSYYQYLHSNLLIYFTIVGGIITIYLNLYIQKFKTKGEGILDRKSISSISNSIVYLFTWKVLFDFILIFALNYLNDSSENNSNSLSIYGGSLDNLITNAIVLSAWGYGIITNKTDDTKDRLHSLVMVSSMLLVITAFVADDYVNFPAHFTSKQYLELIYSLSFAIKELIPALSIILIPIGFYKTQKAMVDKKDTQYLNPLKYSLLFLLISPFIVTSITSLIFNVDYIQLWLFNSTYDLVSSINSLKIVFFDVLDPTVSEISRLDPNLNLASIWSQYLTLYANVIFLFFIWVKDNKGLLNDPVKVKTS
ncbi:hypothetical protein DFJ63DRAFT_313851 [Scheffersomyces coipomensis]|uniref:uncharacterized protein n=1 Tax=Scheffersomyces coipomensis TaxID=1788519 RepID=UPI00315DA3E0